MLVHSLYFYIIYIGLLFLIFLYLHIHTGALTNQTNATTTKAVLMQTINQNIQKIHNNDKSNANNNEEI